MTAPMNLTRTEAPATNPITLASVKWELRLDTSDEDSFIGELIKDAAQYFDGKEGILGRALITQSWRLTLPQFPAGAGPLVIPLPPLQAVDSVSYTDPAGSASTLTTHRVFAGAEPGFILPARGENWPSVQDENPAAVVVDFTAGYGNDETTIPAPITSAMRLFVAHRFMKREDTGRPPAGVMQRIACYRIANGF